MGRAQTHDAIGDALRRATAALREGDVAFMLGGSVACWARGGPRTQNDLDLFVPPDEAEKALAVLERAGMRTERPPEEWLYKAYHGDVMIDVIFDAIGLPPITRGLVQQAEILPVLAIRMPVISIEDVLAGKLLALSEQRLDYTPVVEIARALRERIDWDSLRERTAASPYARAFFALVHELDVLPDAEPSRP
ncbi:MAG: nucleotidyl transferase AbiEii/AbiGii toxin family protein [Solirubrobacteraceae bacterium]